MLFVPTALERPPRGLPMVRLKGTLFGAVCESVALEGKDGEALLKLLQGVICSTVVCKDVDFRSSRLEHFFDIALNVTGDDGGSSEKEGGKSGRPGTVEFALERYFEDEHIEGEWYEAEGFEGKQRAIKRIALAEPPEARARENALTSHARAETLGSLLWGAIAHVVFCSKESRLLPKVLS